MKQKGISIALIMATILILTIFPFPATARQGPKSEDLLIYFRTSVEAAYTMVTAGEADICGYEITKPLYENAIGNPNIEVAPVADMGMYEVDINNNWTIPTYPGVRSPTSYKEFRQAMALLVDKATVIADYCGGFAEQIDQPIAAPTKAWMNESYMGANYPYIYNPVAAATLLNSTFPCGDTDNPYYDPTFPGSVSKIRTYPAGHSKAGQDLDPLIVCCRTDDLRRLYTGQMLYGNLRKLGVPCTPVEGPMGDLYDKVMGEFDYHFYTGGWSLGRFPTYVYYLYHSDWYFPYGPNYVSGYNSTGQPNYPDLDAKLKKVYYASSFSDALSNCKNAMGLFTEYCVTVPLWSSLAFWAYSTNVLGIVNMDGYGPENGYTFMNAYKPDGTPLRYVIKSQPTALNVLYSSWYYDRQVLDRINLYGGLDVPPYDIGVDQGGFIQDWYVDTWDDGGVTKSKVTYWLRDDAYFVKPSTGDQGENINATVWTISAFIQYALDDCWLASAYYPDVHHIVILDDYCVEVYYNDLSYWFTYDCSGAMLPPRVWLQPPFATRTTETFVEGINLTTPGLVGLSGEPAWFASVTADTTPLTMFTDYNWMGAGLDGSLYIYTNLPADTVVKVDYWKVGDAKGYYPGGVAWQTSLEGAGMYYATDVVPGAGGYASLKRNPYYYMETPPEHSEIDFKWVWGAVDESRRIDANRAPRTGYYIVDDYDLDLAREAYATQGTGIPDKYWFAGADLAPPAGVVDIFDVSSIQGNWKVKHSEIVP